MPGPEPTQDPHGELFADPQNTEEIQANFQAIFGEKMGDPAELNWDDPIAIAAAMDEYDPMSGTGDLGLTGLGGHSETSGYGNIDFRDTAQGYEPPAAQGGGVGGFAQAAAAFNPLESLMVMLKDILPKDEKKPDKKSGKPKEEKVAGPELPPDQPSAEEPTYELTYDEDEAEAYTAEELTVEVTGDDEAAPITPDDLRERAEELAADVGGDETAPITADDVRGRAKELSAAAPDRPEGAADGGERKIANAGASEAVPADLGSNELKREEKNRGTLTGGTTEVTLAPGTKLEIIGFGDARAVGGPPDAETDR